MTQLRVIRWEAPGPVVRKRHEPTGAEEVLAVLNDRPGEWAVLVDTDDAETMRRARVALRTFVRGRGVSDQYEIVERRGTYRHCLYVCYMPDVDR